MNAFPFIYLMNFIKMNPVKTIAAALAFIIAPFLNCLEDVSNSEKIDYRYEKDGKLFYVTQSISNREICYELKTFDKNPQIKNGCLITYSYNDANIFIWIAFVIACLFPIAGLFISDEDANFDFKGVFEATASYYVTCELEEGIYYYFYGDRFLGKSDRCLNNERRHIGSFFGLSNPTKIRNFPKWKTKTQNRTKKLEDLGV